MMEQYLALATVPSYLEFDVPKLPVFHPSQENLPLIPRAYALERRLFDKSAW